MTHRIYRQLGPGPTPVSLKILILTTLASSIAAAFLPSLQSLFSLSWEGVSHFYLWQFATYLFMPSAGVSFSLFLYLAFNLYLLWTFGASLLQRVRTLSFFGLYFGSAIFAGLAILPPLALFHSSAALAGNSPALYALLTAWTMLNPSSQILLFFAVPIKAAWLILGLLGANLLIDVSNGDWLHFLSYAAASLFGYFFALIAWRTPSPFPFLRGFEKRVFRALDRIHERWRRFGKKSSSPYRPSKIYDIHSGEPLLGDEQFMDAMLARISLHGEDSLTPEEKKRMQSISEKKASQKK